MTKSRVIKAANATGKSEEVVWTRPNEPREKIMVDQFDPWRARETDALPDVEYTRSDVVEKITSQRDRLLAALKPIALTGRVRDAQHGPAFAESGR